MRFLKLLFGLAVAIFLHVFGLRLWPALPLVFDPFVILVLLLSLERHPAWSTFAGAVAGLVHDALGIGLYGFHGLALTIVGYAAARLQQRLVIQRPAQVALLFAVATALQQALLASLQFLMLENSELPLLWSVLAIVVSTATLAVAIFLLDRRLRRIERHWRAERQRRLTLEVRQ